MKCAHRHKQTNFIVHSTAYCSGIYLEDTEQKKRWKNPIMKSHQVWQKLVYLREKGGISEHLISFSPVWGVHLRLESCLWERPVICATVHTSSTTRFHFAYKQDLIKTQLFSHKMLLWRCNKQSDHDRKGFLKYEWHKKNTNSFNALP